MRSPLKHPQISVASSDWYDEIGVEPPATVEWVFAPLLDSPITALRSSSLKPCLVWLAKKIRDAQQLLNLPREACYENRGCPPATVELGLCSQLLVMSLTTLSSLR